MSNDNPSSPVPADPVAAELLDLSRQLLDSIDRQDWAVYEELCDPALTAYEPEGVGSLVTGMEFHRFYFELEASGRPTQSIISSPQIHLLGDVALVTYVRQKQRVEADGRPTTVAFEETRIWQKQNGRWKHIHFHRSRPGSGTM